MDLSPLSVTFRGDFWKAAASAISMTEACSYEKRVSGWRVQAIGIVSPLDSLHPDHILEPQLNIGHQFGLHAFYS